MKKFFSPVDHITPDEMVALGFGPVTSRKDRKSVMATPTGVKRPPKAGEWYLQGAIPEAYKARNNLVDSYHLAKLVRVRITVVTSIEEVKDGN